MIVGGHLGGGAAAEAAFVTAMAVFAVGETLLSPTLPAIINDLAPPHAVGRYNGLGTLAFTVGFLLGPAAGTAALGAGWGSGLFSRPGPGQPHRGWGGAPSGPAPAARRQPHPGTARDQSGSDSGRLAVPGVQASRRRARRAARPVSTTALIASLRRGTRCCPGSRA